MILAIYETGLEVRHKADCSPVTDADEAAERIILRHLSDAFPQIPVVAEEAASPAQCRILTAAPSFSSIRWTARANSSAATTTSPSTSR